MSLNGFLRFVFSFKLIAAVILVWFLFNSQVMAWQQAGYTAYPNYRVPVNYNPYTYRPTYPVYNYPNNYYPQPVYYAPRPPQTAVIIEPVKQPKINIPPKKSPQQSVIIDNTSELKQLFINNLIPFIDLENLRLKQLRERVSLHINKLEANLDISQEAKTWLKKIAKKYRIKGDPLNNSPARQALLSKIDIIPASLTLAQAANESAWGKSRFATEANNLFGIWTYDEKKGLKPANRDAEKKHLIRKFDHYGDSVAYYMFTLNSHPAYQELRDIRQQQRDQKTALDGYAMATGLQKYSAKGDLYIKLIRDLIRQNQWARLDRITPSA